MIIIGELINGMYKDVARAILNRESDLIQHLAEDQIKAGASFLDVSTGPFSKDPMEDMKWLVTSIQKVTDVSLSIDSTKPEVIEEGLKLAHKRTIINSTTADDDKMGIIFDMAKRYQSQVIALTMDKSGMPNSKDKRVELAAKIIARASDSGVAIDDLYVDPIIYPINVGQSQIIEALDAIREFKMISNPAPKIVIGLSNISQGGKNRSLLNRTLLTLALASGLTAAILDPLDQELMDSMIAAELILNKKIYCDSFLEACRRG